MFRLSIREMFLITTIAVLVIGWWREHQIARDLLADRPLMELRLEMADVAIQHLELENEDPGMFIPIYADLPTRNVQPLN